MKGDALDMHELEPGMWVLSPLACSENRREYFQRAHAILTFHFVTAGYCVHGRDAIEDRAKQLKFQDTTKIRLTFDGRTLQTTYGQHKRYFFAIGPRLTNQAFLMVYGNFETYLADQVSAGLKALGVADTEQAVLDLTARSRWRGKMDRISQRLGISLGKSEFVERFRDVGLDFLGRETTDPIEFLQNMATLRHLLVHSTGRASEEFVTAFPKAGLTVGRPMFMPMHLPYDVHMFFVVLTDLLDQRFCERFGWPRPMVAPENLMEPWPGVEETPGA